MTYFLELDSPFSKVLQYPAKPFVRTYDVIVSGKVRFTDVLGVSHSNQVDIGPSLLSSLIDTLFPHLGSDSHLPPVVFDFFRRLSEDGCLVVA